MPDGFKFTSDDILRIKKNAVSYRVIAMQHKLDSIQPNVWLIEQRVTVLQLGFWEGFWKLNPKFGYILLLFWT